MQEQVLDQILLRLTEPQERREDAVVLGRLGFLEWLVSIPDECDIHEQARMAHERAAPLRQCMPAIGVLCNLLMDTQQHVKSELPVHRRVKRRRSGPRRRPLH